MNLNNSSGIDLIPSDFNEVSLGPFREIFYKSIESVENKYRPPLFWTIRIALELENNHYYLKKIPGFQKFAIGFLDPDFEKDGFGVIIIKSPSTRNLKQFEKIFLDDLIIDGLRFPVVIREEYETLHNLSCHPYGGSGSCWAVSRVSSKIQGPGLLTSKHVVGSTLGSDIQMTCGCQGKILDVGPEGIDAALISTDCARAKNFIPTLQLVPQWLDVYYSGASSGYRKTKVTAITDTMGILNNAAFPSRVMIAEPGRPGDSGALIRDFQTNNGIGIYMGAYSNPAGQSGGFSQNAYQVTQLMDMELYD